MGYEEVQQPILTGLVGMVKTSDEGSVPKAILGKWLSTIEYDQLRFSQ